MGEDEGFRNIGALSLASVTVMSIDTTLISLRGVALESSATLNACADEKDQTIEFYPSASNILTLMLIEYVLVASLSRSPVTIT
jgi:hypothetical protein